AGFDRAFHETLPVSDVLAGEEDLAVRAGDDRAEAEPLARTVECVRAVSVFVTLPRIRGDAACTFGSVFVEIDEVTGDDPQPTFVGLRGEHIGLFADRIRTQDTFGAGLILRAVKVVVRRGVGDKREV